jgi:hypothetical protein
MTMPMNATGLMSSKRTGGGDKIPRGYRKGQIQQFTPEMMQLFSSLFGHLGPDSFLSKLASGDQGAFEEMEAPALKQFAGLQGQLASRFSGMGEGGRHSSGFNVAANQQSQDFASQLQSQRLGIRNQALQDLMGMSNQLLQQRPYEQFLVKKSMPFWQQLLLGANERGQDLAMMAGKAALGGGF